MKTYAKQHHKRKPRHDYRVLANEIARLRRRITAASDFDRVPKRVQDRYVELMDEQDRAQLRAAYRRGEV